MYAHTRACAVRVLIEEFWNCITRVPQLRNANGDGYQGQGLVHTEPACKFSVI